MSPSLTTHSAKLTGVTGPTAVGPFTNGRLKNKEKIHRSYAKNAGMHSKRFLLVALLLCLCVRAGRVWAQTTEESPSNAAQAAELDKMPVYLRAKSVTGAIRNNGSGFAGLLSTWEAGFRKLQPRVTVQDALLSGDSAIALLSRAPPTLPSTDGNPC